MPQAVKSELINYLPVAGIAGLLQQQPHYRIKLPRLCAHQRRIILCQALNLKYVKNFIPEPKCARLLKQFPAFRFEIPEGGEHVDSLVLFCVNHRSTDIVQLNNLN